MSRVPRQKELTARARLESLFALDLFALDPARLVALWAPRASGRQKGRRDSIDGGVIQGSRRSAVWSLPRGRLHRAFKGAEDSQFGVVLRLLEEKKSA